MKCGRIASQLQIYKYIYVRALFAINTHANKIAFTTGMINIIIRSNSLLGKITIIKIREAKICIFSFVVKLFTVVVLQYYIPQLVVIVKHKIFFLFVVTFLYFKINGNYWTQYFNLQHNILYNLNKFIVFNM